MEGDWSLTWCVDGRFYEQFNGSEMTIEYGYDGQNRPWHADAGGRVTDLELDNLEACLLALWIRTGHWLTEEGQRKLVIQRERKTLSGTGAPVTNELQLSICLKDKKVVGHISIDLSTWLPIKMESKAFGGTERWEFAGWQNVMPESGFKFANSTSYYPAAGGKHFYSVHSSNSSECVKQDFAEACVYTHPTTSLLPRHTSHPHAHIDNSCSPSVKMIRSRSGHYFVCPLVDEQNLGYFIVDTGASGLVISGKKADEVGMDAFGEVFVTGVEGKFKTKFRRGKCFQLGPLSINSPIYIQAPADDVVKGVSEEVSGICGFDLFHHCVVEMSSVESRLSLYDPLLYRPPEIHLIWEDLTMLDNVPHTQAKFNGQTALLMIDTGAGGIDIIFHKRAIEEFDLLGSLQWKGSAEVSGLGTGSGGIKVEYGILDGLEVGGHFFSQVKALHFSNDEGALDISIYTAGVLCGELIVRHLVIFDYPNHRFALVRA